MPKEPLIRLLIDKKYNEALEFVVPVFKEYYIAQHKNHSNDITYLQELVDDKSEQDWEKFFDLIEWRFEEDDELQIRARLTALVAKLCEKFGVEVKQSKSILNEITGMLDSQSMEKDFLNKVVHVSQIELLVRQFVREAKIEEKLDPLHRKWDEMINNDIRNFEEKILNVCPTYSRQRLDELGDDFVEGKFEQDNSPEIKEIKAYNYRVYRACKRHISNILKQKQTFSEQEIEMIFSELIDIADNYILDKSKTYKMPFKDRDMIYKSVLILFQECFLALDTVGELDG